MLTELLTKVDLLFHNPKKEKSETIFVINYSLDKFARGWQFEIVDNWQTWVDKKLQFQFGLYRTPEDAVKAFLLYVEEHKINVRGLMEDYR